MADSICLVCLFVCVFVCLAPVVETYKRECCDYLIDIIWMHAIASLFLRLTILKSNTIQFVFQNVLGSRLWLYQLQMRYNRPFS